MAKSNMEFFEIGLAALKMLLWIILKCYVLPIFAAHHHSTHSFMTATPYSCKIFNFWSKYNLLTTPAALSSKANKRMRKSHQ
jgi:hypothetical protein